MTTGAFEETEADGLAVSMQDALQEVLLLQTEYSSSNTPSMQRRGMLIRNDIPSWMRTQLAAVRAAAPAGVDDLAVKGRDGTGLKSQTPWARVFSSSRSPAATEGWYVVYLFSEAGDRVYVSLNQGTTRWSQGEFRARPKAELLARVAWARDVLRDEISGRDDLQARIDLQANGRLGQGYEIGNVAAIEYPLDDVPSDVQLAEDLRFLTRVLCVLYAAESNALNVPGEPAPEVADAEAAVERSAGRRARRQGFRLSVAEKLAIEKHAVLITTEYLTSAAGGAWTVRDVGATSSFDLDARRGDDRLYVEVKGTTSLGEEIILTRNEVELHRAEHPHNMLAVVSSIELDREQSPPRASGGVLRVLSPWEIDQDRLTPMAYTYNVPRDTPSDLIERSDKAEITLLI